MNSLTAGTLLQAASSRLPSILGAWLIFTASNDLVCEMDCTQIRTRGKQIYLLSLISTTNITDCSQGKKAALKKPYLIDVQSALSPHRTFFLSELTWLCRSETIFVS